MILRGVTGGQREGVESYKSRAASRRVLLGQERAKKDGDRRNGNDDLA